MSMRYLIRRKNPEDLSDIRARVPDLDEQLGDAAKMVGPQADLNRPVTVNLSQTRSLFYTFFARKTEKGYEWVCPSLELVAETEPELHAMLGEFKVTNTAHLRT